MSTVESMGAAVPGLKTLGKHQVRAQRISVLMVTLLPFIGLAVGIATLWGWGITALDLTVMTIAYVISGLGVTIGYHRLLTHKSFDTSDRLRAFFAVAGGFAVQGSVISWVADHRRHHTYADKEGDPHSPHLSEGKGLMGRLNGLGHAHIGWLFAEERTEVQRWAPDLHKNRTMRKVDKLFPLLVVISLTTPAIVGFAFTGTLSGAIRTFLWAGLGRVFLLHHVTWSINSICHYFGKRPYDTPDMSTNAWPLALISFGECWHNNHHAFPTSAIHGIDRFQPDPSGWIIRGLEKMGLAHNLRRPSEEQVASRRS